MFEHNKEIMIIDDPMSPYRQAPTKEELLLRCKYSRMLQRTVEKRLSKGAENGRTDENQIK